MTKYDNTSVTNDSKPFNTFRKSRIKRTIDKGKVATTLKCNTVDTKIAEIFYWKFMVLVIPEITYERFESKNNKLSFKNIEKTLPWQKKTDRWK